MRSRTRRTAEELEALLEGRLSADEAGAEARRLATLASTVAEEQPGPVATLAEDRRLLLRDRILDDIAALDAPTPDAPTPETAPAAPARRKRPVRAAVASGLASTMIAATGVTVAAQEALPGDALYGLKKGTESVRMNLAADATQAARLELRFAEERLDEVTAGAGRLPAPALVDSLAEMDQRSMAGAQQLVLSAEQAGDEELLLEVDAFLERQSAGIVEVFPRLPVQVRPHAEDSLAVLREIRNDLLVPALEACDCLDVVPASHSDSEFVRRTTSEPLPPATADQQTQDSLHDTDGTTEDEDADLREPVDDLTSGDTTTSDDGDGVRNQLRETVEETEEQVDDTVDRTGDAVDETTDTLDDTVDETTDTLDDTVDETTDTLDDTVDETTESVGDLLGSTTHTANRLLGR